MGRSRFGDRARANLVRHSGNIEGIRLGGVFEVKCFDRGGRLKWVEFAKNLVVNVGLAHTRRGVLGVCSVRSVVRGSHGYGTVTGSG